MIAIIDYGAGNIFSVKNALDYLGLESRLVSDKESVKAADAVILPGVGAFPAAMRKLEATGLVDTIKEEAARKPFLGICLGMSSFLTRAMSLRSATVWDLSAAASAKWRSLS